MPSTRNVVAVAYIHEVVVSECSHFLTRGGRLRELPTTGLWLEKIWCFGWLWLMAGGRLREVVAHGAIDVKINVWFPKLLNGLRSCGLRIRPCYCSCQRTSFFSFWLVYPLHTRNQYSELILRSIQNVISRVWIGRKDGEKKPAKMCHRAKVKYEIYCDSQVKASWKCDNAYLFSSCMHW